MKKIFTNPGLRNTLRYGVLAGMALIIAGQAAAQDRLMLNAGSAEKTLTGPSTAPQTAALNRQSSQGYLASGVTVTASFTTDASAGTITPGNLQFGAAQNTNGNSAAGLPVIAALGSVSAPASEMFATAENAEVSVSDAYAFSLFSSTHNLANAGLATDGRHQLGQVTLTFSEAVSNPVLHLAGLGATVGELGITTELELADKSVVLSRLSGNNNLVVSSDKIGNNAANPDASSFTGAASGSVLAKGTAIKSLTFKVFLKGDKAGLDWEKTGQYNGDRWLLGVSTEPNAFTTGNALPIYITDFNAVHNAPCQVHISWKTNTELGMSNMVVEHSTDGVSFEDVYSIESDGKAAGHSYTYTYPHATSGTNFFRIRSKDILDERNYGQIARVLVHCDESPVEIYPNPAQNVLHIHGATEGQVVHLSNMFGKVQQTQTLTSSEGMLNLEGLQPGIYLLSIANQNGEEVSRTRITKQ